MRDQVSVKIVSELHPAIKDKVEAAINKAEAGFPQWMAIRIAQGIRDIDYQNGLYAQGRTKPGKIVTDVRGGYSYHNYGLAVDFALLIDKDRNGKYDTVSWDTEGDLDQDKQKDWMEVVAIFKAAGFEWGGDWKSPIDRPHFQMPFGYKASALLARVNAGMLIPGTKFVKL